MSEQNIREQIQDQKERGLMSAAEANVALVRGHRYRLVKNRVPRDVRAALNAAVKAGKLGHLKKDGHKPEAYYHPTFDYLARAARNREAEKVALATKKFYGWPAV